MSVASVECTITQTQINEYADASGDDNPIHVEPAFAATTAFGGTIAHGMLVLAQAAQMMHAAHGDAWLRGGRMKVRFKAPTRPGDTVTASATGQKPATDGIEYTIVVANQSGETLIEGRASVLLP